MPVTWAWDNADKTVIRFTFVDPWSWHEFTTANNEAGRQATELDCIVDAIFDMRQGKIIPIGAVPMFSRAARDTAAATNQGLTVVIGMQSYMYALYDVIARIYPPVQNMVRFAVDDAAAYNIIETEQARRNA